MNCRVTLMSYDERGSHHVNSVVIVNNVWNVSYYYNSYHISFHVSMSAAAAVTGQSFIVCICYVTGDLSKASFHTHNSKIHFLP